MKINYKNINQTFFENVEKYIKFRDKVTKNTYILYVDHELCDQYKFLLHRIKKDYLKIKLGIFVEPGFFSEESMIGKNIIKSPLFNGYFKCRYKEYEYFFALYNKEVLFYTYFDAKKYSSHCMERFCERRYYRCKKIEKIKTKFITKKTKIMKTLKKHE